MFQKALNLKMQSQINENKIVQWNCDGFYSHHEDFKLIIQDYNPYIICIQETKFKHDHIPILKNYKSFYKNVNSTTVAKGGVVTFVNENFDCEEIAITSNIQAVAVKVYYPVEFIICNIYLPGNEQIPSIELTNIMSQFNLPFMLLGDFNAHNILWGSDINDNRGTKIEKLIEDNELNIMNSGAPTHYSFSYKTTSSIDLTLITPSLDIYFGWFVDDDLHSSDHYPIIVNVIHDKMNKERKRKWVLKKADWENYEKELDIKSLHFANINEHEIYIKDKIVDAATKSIPITSNKPMKKTVPWWNQEIHELIKLRKKKLRMYQQTMNLNYYKEFLIAKYESRKLVRKLKKASWEDFVETINVNTPSSKVYGKIRQISGKYKNNTITSLIVDGNLITDTKEICEKIVESFVKASSTNNYTNEFKQFKEIEEVNTPIIPEDYNNEDYNRKFTMDEMETALKVCKGTSPGPDTIQYEMIKKMNLKNKNELLKLYNRIFLVRDFPENWKSALLVPILKNGKDPKCTKNYRPIALTNCLCKVMERMINKRIIWWMETLGKFNVYQSGFRKNRSTADNICLLESEMMEAFTRQEYLVSIFFDLEKAYDTTWRQLVVKETIGSGLKGNIVHFIQNFLTERNVQVTVGPHISEKKILENGIPQGSVLSVTLFIITINKVFSCIQSPVKSIMYADDLVIFVSSKNIKEIQEKLQCTLDKLSKWCEITGFKFSKEKTNAMIFTRKRKLVQNPVLLLNATLINFVDKYKFLGVTFDKKLKWAHHIKEIKAKATKNLNIIKMLSHSRFGADRKTLLKIHKTMILPVLDYGNLVYATANKNILSTINTVHNTGVRLATGAFRTSPIESVMADGEQTNLQTRRDKQTIIYATKILSSEKHPLYKYFQNQHKYTRLKQKKLNYQPFYVRAKSTIISHNINININIDKQKYHKYPPWKKRNMKIDVSLSKYNKSDTSKTIFLRQFNKILSQQQNQCHIMYTDGSVINEYTGCGITSSIFDQQYHLQNNTSIFSAELFAILRAVETTPKNINTIFSDSLSALQELKNQYSNNTLVQKIQDKILESKKTFNFIWIPSHIGIKGNEHADFLAKDAINKPQHKNYKYFVRDFRNVIKQETQSKWKQYWEEIPNTNKLKKIQSTVPKWKNLHQLTRMESIKMTRLRIGHTLATHKYVFDRTTPPLCICNERLTIEHIFNNCQGYQQQRIQYGITNTSILAEDTSKSTNKIINFLKEISLYDKI